MILTLIWWMLDVPNSNISYFSIRGLIDMNNRVRSGILQSFFV